MEVQQDVFSIPLELYPRYLILLQRQHQVKIKAIAVIENVELFWAYDEGDEIGKTANQESQRLFVFPNQQS